MNKGNKQIRKNTNAGTRPAKGAKAVPQNKPLTQAQRNEVLRLMSGGQMLQKKPRRTREDFVSPGRMAAAPVIQGRQVKSRKAHMVSSPNGDCRVRHREYLTDVVAEGSSPSIFKSQGFPINPGQASFAPWLSQIAPRFQKYRFNKVKICYETEAPTSLGGSVLLTVDYNAQDPAPTSKVQAMAYKNAVRSPPWEECCHTSAPEDLSQVKEYFVRPGPLPADADIKTYDVGNFFFCSQNIVTGGATLGELYVEYDVLLMTPQLQLPSESGIDSLAATGNTAMTPALPFGTLPLITSSVPDPALLSYNDVSGVWTFSRTGSFSFAFTNTGTTITAITYSGTLAAGIIAASNGLVVNAGATSAVDFTLGGVAVTEGDTFKAVMTSASSTVMEMIVTECSVGV